MDKAFTEKMTAIQERLLKYISSYFNDKAVEAHIFGSHAKENSDALSDIDIWLTFDDRMISEIIRDRMSYYSRFGQIILLHEMQNNFPLNGVQTAIIYKIDGELIRVDFYLCPLSSSRILPGSRILFEKVKVPTGDIIPETKRTLRDVTDRITFLIIMCFNVIKKVVRKDQTFMDFLMGEFKKSEKDIPELSMISNNGGLDMIRKSLAVLENVSNEGQKRAIAEIRAFMSQICGT